MLRKHAEALERVVEAYTRKVDKHVPIHPEYAASVLDELAADDAVFTVDTGMCNVWAARYLTPNGRRRVIGSFMHGTMANALPHAIGAQFADRAGRSSRCPATAASAMLMGELLTAVQYDLPVKVVVFNNSSLGMVEAGDAGRRPARRSRPTTNPWTSRRSPAARGIHSVAGREDPSDSPAACKQALAHDGPACVDLVTDPNALSIPPTSPPGRSAASRWPRPGPCWTAASARMLELARVQPAQHPPSLTSPQPPCPTPR